MKKLTNVFFWTAVVAFVFLWLGGLVFVLTGSRFIFDVGLVIYAVAVVLLVVIPVWKLVRGGVS